MKPAPQNRVSKSDARGSRMSRKISTKPYKGPAGGWGSVRSLAGMLRRQGVLASGALTLSRQNKVDGFQCASCAWSKPANPLPFEFCENGAKATTWEITARRCTPAFFAEHTVTELLSWPDFDLEQAGRLTHPLRYDPASDTYQPIAWDTAFDDIAEKLSAITDRKRTIFYSSGRSSNEASYLYALFARLHGNNNLPDSSNMCHETTSVALPASIGVPVGTTTLDDFAYTDCILNFGQNPGSNSPRMLHPLQEAAERGVPIIVYNPLRERGLERFTSPQSPREMLTGYNTPLASQYHQVKAGGDFAALTGICKCLVDMDAAGEAVLDHDFIATHTNGFDSFAAWLGDQSWDTIERESGLARAALQATATVYAKARAAIGIYGMGLTQHVRGVETVRMLVNLLLLRGNIGKPGAGICPVRGHSNVQGQRTVGVTEKPELIPMDRLAKQFGFDPPREPGLNTVEACEAILAGEVEAFFMLGGNFVRAIPDHGRMEPAWRRIPLTITVATKLNRSALVHGQTSYLLPVIGRVEIDQQGTGPQATSMEDTTSCVHGSKGVRTPASRHLISEVRLIAEIARRSFAANPKTPWAAWADDYSLIRQAIGETYPEIFWDYDRRMWQPGGFHRPLPARERIWKTDTGKANFLTPAAQGLGEDPEPSGVTDVLRLITMRSNDQFNTTIYGYSDRFRGIEGTRDILLMHDDDIARHNLTPGQEIILATAAADGISRELSGLRVVPYNIPVGCVGAYYPEANVLLPVGHHADGSKVPAAKSIPVTLRAASA